MVLLCLCCIEAIDLVMVETPFGAITDQGLTLRHLPPDLVAHRLGSRRSDLPTRAEVASVTKQLATMHHRIWIKD